MHTLQRDHHFILKYPLLVHVTLYPGHPEPFIPLNPVLSHILHMIVTQLKHDIKGDIQSRWDGLKQRFSDGVVLNEGLEAMRRSYAEWFGSLPGLRAEVLNRVERGSWVVDEEHVTAQGLDMRALVAYRVRDDLIDQVVIMTDEDVSPD